MLDDQADLAAQHVAFQFADLGQVELVDQLAVDALLQLFELLSLPSALATESAWGELRIFPSDPSRGCSSVGWHVGGAGTAGDVALLLLRNHSLPLR